MPVPSSPDARLFYRAAEQRFEDAEFLLTAKRTTAAIYLAGYAVECILKALILSGVPRGQQDDVLGEFRGARAHDFDWLLRQYRQRGGAGIPRPVSTDLKRLTTWSTDLRYSPSSISVRRAREFLNSASRVLEWAEGRMT